MIFSLFGGFQNAFASEEKGEYIVYLDVEKQSPDYVKEYEKQNYEKAIELADEALDYYQEKILEKVPNLEVLSRLELLLPSLCVKASKDELNIIKGFDFVKDVYVNEELREADVVRSNMAIFKDKSLMSDSIKMIGSNELIDNDDVLQEKYNGAGSVLAIIDSNMDPSHEAFYLSASTQARLSKLDIHEFLRNGSLKVKDHGEKDALVKSLYRSDKIPFGWNYMVGTDNLNPENELEAHGQHVSGTVAGNKVQIGSKTWRGVAPEAQLLMMNVMKKGSTSSNVYMHAMQDAIVMGADAVNMSLGSTKGLPNSVPKYITDAINNGYAADTNIVIAAGNEGDYQGKLNIENPDFGTMASPGIATNAITVASLENKIMFAQVMDYEGVKLPFRKAGDINFEKGDYEFIDCGLGNTEDFEGKDVAGKVALIKRGGLTFTQKIKNAEAVRAKGVIIYNNVEGELGLAIEGTKIPAVAVTLKVGEKLLNGKSKTVHIDMTPREMDNPEYGELSSFTNWGLAAGGYMKPDITAPGGHIYSTQTSGNTFGDMSGTSMATPHVTGGVGVIRTRLNELLFAGEKHKAALTKTILMNSAVPHMDPVTGFTTSPRRQGAGVMNLTKASKLDFTVVDKDTKIASKYVGDVNDEITLNLTITNYSAEPKTLTPFVQATIEAREGKTLSLRPDKLFDKNFDYKIEVPAQGTKDVTITFPIENTEKFADFVNGAFVEGFLHLSDQNGMEVSFPFVSFKGEFGKIPSIEKPLYDFTFENGDEPMYWSYAFKQNDWFKYSTHFETIQGSYLGEDGKKYNNIVIAGLKNFDDIDAYKAEPNGEEPKPEFEPVVISPNGDNYNDALGLNLVMTRSANVKATVINEAGEEKDYPLGLNLTNISFIPDDNSRKTYLGYTSPGTIPVKDLKDGKYTLKLSAEAVKSANENYPATFREMKFMIDTIAPQFENTKYDEASRTITFDLVEEGSGIDEFKIEDESGKAIDFTREGNKVKLVLPEGKELADINITAMDFGHNTNAVTADMLVFKDMYGSLEVEVKQSGKEPLNLEYKVVDEAGEEVKSIEHLKFGKYKLIVTDYSNKFELKGESEIAFEISEENKNHKIVLEFTEIPTARVSVKVKSQDNLKAGDFRIFAKNIKNDRVIEFVYSPTWGEYYDADLPYGDYNFYAEFKEGLKGYEISFEEEMPFTASSATNYETIYANIKRADFYKVNITTEGTSEEIKYLAKSEKGAIVELDDLADGTWMIFPEKMPEGYYIEKPFVYVTLTEEKPEADVTFTYEEIGDKKFKFTIKDNYDKADYYICDFYGWVSNGKEGEAFDYEKGSIELKPGYYYVEAIADKEKFGETTISIDNQSYEQDSTTFKSVTEDVEVEFNWKAYSETDKVGEGIIFVNQDILPMDKQKGSYEYVLTGTKGEPISKTFGMKDIDSWIVDLPYDYYKVEVKGIPEGYTVDTKDFVVAYPEFQVELKIIPQEEEEPAEKVKVNFEFYYNNEKISPVKFNLDEDYETEYTDGEVELTLGEHELEVFEPEEYVQKEEFSTINITKDTKNLRIELEEYKEPPAPEGEGTLKFEVWESDGTTKKQSDMFISAWAGAIYLSNNEVKDKVPYGTYKVELSDYMLDQTKYDLDKSEIVKTVTIDDKNPNAVVKFVLILKGSTPVPEPTGKGKASWDINYTGSKVNPKFFEKVKLYRIKDGKDEEVKLNYSQESQHAEIELEFGKYAYVLEDLPSYQKVEVKNKRIEFTLDAENPTFKAIFEIEDKKETQKVDLRNVEVLKENINDYTFRVFDMDGKEIEGVKKTTTGFEFPAASGTDYEIKIEGTKYTFYPNIINAYPSPVYSKYVYMTLPLPLKVNSLAGDKEIKAKYGVYAKSTFGVTNIEDLTKVPYIASGNQVYQVNFLSCEQGYKLKDEEIKEFTVSDYSKQELTFNFERDETQEIVNTGELEALIKEYDELKETDNYKNTDAAKRQAYDDAIAEAKAELEKDKTTQDAIDALAEKVRAARDAIVGSMVDLRKEELKKLLDEADAVKAKDTYIYDTAEDKEAYDAAIAKGQKVYEDLTALEKDVINAIKDIEDAKKNLDGYNEANKEELQKLVDEYDNVRKTKKYMNSTREEKDKYDDAIVDGYNILHKQKATQDEVDKAVKDIKDVYAKLSGIEEPTEITAAPKVNDATVNDRFITGEGIVGATVYYKVGEDGNLRTGMKIMEGGKFSLDLGQVHENDKIFVYQQEVNKLMSDGVIVNILPLDKSELLELIAKAEKIKDTDQYKYAPEDRQKDLDDELVKAIKVKDDENSSMEDIEKTIVNLRSAIASIENYEIIRHEVTFYLNNETDPWTVKIIDGENVNRPDDPVRKGYIFKGWYADEELTQEFDFNTIIEANTDIYAKWEEILEYEITFDPNNGEATWTEKVREGEKVKEPAKPTKANLTFIAWQFNGENYDFNTSVMANMMLIAKWEENKPEPQPEPQPDPRPEPQPEPYEPYESYEPYRPEPKPSEPSKPVEPSKPSEPSKPINNNEDEKPVETKKDLGIITEYPTSSVETVVLKDVPAGPEGEAIRNLVSYGIIQGTGKGKFEGNKTINRAMVTRVFMLISKDKAIDKDVYFSDVTNDKWYAESVKWAAAKGIIAGYTDGTFKADKKVTRQEFCVMLMNLLKANGIELETVVPVDEAEFAKADSWAKDAMIAMKRAGLVNVEANGKFGPQSKFTREELAKTIDLLIKLIKIKEK